MRLVFGLNEVAYGVLVVPLFLEGWRLLCRSKGYPRVLRYNIRIQSTRTSNQYTCNGAASRVLTTISYALPIGCEGTPRVVFAQFHCRMTV